MIHSMPDFIAKVQAIVDYNWDAELTDYQDPENENEGHVFLILRDLQAFINDETIVEPEVER